MARKTFYRWLKKYLKKEYRGLHVVYEVEQANPTAVFEDSVRIISVRTETLIEKGGIVKDDENRAAFVSRLGTLAKKPGMAVYAWAVMSNLLIFYCAGSESMQCVQQTA